MGLRPGRNAADPSFRRGQADQLTKAKLSKLPQLTITVTFKTSRGLSPGSFTGPSLWTVLTDAQALDPTKPRGFVGDTILTTGRDDYVAAVAAGEIAPQFETKNIILAEQMNSKSLGQFHLRLVVTKSENSLC